MGLLDSLSSLRGGAAVAETVVATLQSGPWGVLSLWGVAASVVVPLTLYRQAFSFSVGYGYSVLAMGAALAHAFGTSPIPSSPTDISSLITSGVIFYGFRLGTYLAFRNLTVQSNKKKLKEFDKSPRLKRIPLALGVSLFYALLTSPALYALRNVSENTLAKGGIGLAWVGALMEAIADTQKYIAKRGKDQSKDFVGPTSGVYRICRHPNYLGEVLFWLGLGVNGVSSFGSNLIPYATTTLGLYGIYSIMTSATKRLDQQQLEKYGGQTKYEKWRSEVPAPIFPCVNEE